MFLLAFFLSIYSWSTTKDFSAIIFACKLTCAKLLEFCEVFWWSRDRLFDFVVIEVSSGKINGYSVLGIGIEIMGV